MCIPGNSSKDTARASRSVCQGTLASFREQPISPKSHKALYLKRDAPAQLSCMPRYRAGKYAAARAHARSCAWARWAATAASRRVLSAFSRAVALARRGRYGGCQLWHGALASVTCRGVYGTAASTVRRLWRGSVRRILRLCCARTLFPIKSVQRSRSM